MDGAWFNEWNGRPPPVRIRIQRALATWQSQSWRHRYQIAVVITAIAGVLSHSLTLLYRLCRSRCF